MGCVTSIERTNSQFAIFLSNDVHAEIFGFLEANDQARLRRTSKHFCRIFNHAFQRGYVAAAIQQGYVDKLDAMKEDGEDGHPLLRVAPVDPKALFWMYGKADPKELCWKRVKELQRSKKDEEATLFVNVRLVLGSGKTVLEKDFLRESTFKAVHLYGTETVEKVEHNFLCQAKMQTFTMTTPCLKLREVGDCWLHYTNNLTHFDVSGCCALERVGDLWLWFCPALKSLSFKGCRQLKKVGNSWMSNCSDLTSTDLGDLVALEVVGKSWLLSCTSLRSVDFSSCRELRVVGKSWLGSCCSLSSVDFSPCCSLCNVGASWLCYCRALRTVDLRGCVALEEVGDDLLKSTPSLLRILVSKDHKLPVHVTNKLGQKLVMIK